MGNRSAHQPALIHGSRAKRRGKSDGSMVSECKVHKYRPEVVQMMVKKLFPELEQKLKLRKGYHISDKRVDAWIEVHTRKRKFNNVDGYQ